MPCATFSMLVYLASVLDKLVMANAMRDGDVLSGASLHGQFMPTLTCSSLLLSQNEMYLFLSIVGFFHRKSSFYASFVIRVLALLYISLYVTVYPVHFP